MPNDACWTVYFVLTHLRRLVRNANYLPGRIFSDNGEQIDQLAANLKEGLDWFKKTAQEAVGPPRASPKQVPNAGCCAERMSLHICG